MKQWMPEFSSSVQIVKVQCTCRNCPSVDCKELIVSDY